LSTNELRDVLTLPYQEVVRTLSDELSAFGYACSLLYLPNPILRVSYGDNELDISIHAAYVDILGNAVPYKDAASHVRRVLDRF
jgi:hypothetical protein